MKAITIAGNLGKDAVVRTTQSGDKVTSFSVAVTERAGRDEKRTLWFDVSLWGQRGEALSPYLRKGGKVAVSGDLSTREHEGRTYLTVRANEVTLLGDGGGDGGRRDAPPAGQSGRQSGGGDFGRGRGDFDDDIPF